MTSEPQRFVCPSCFRPLDGPGKESDINYREADHALVLRLGCHHCKEAVFIAVPLGVNFAVRIGGREFRSKRTAAS